jgi:hypothetical protein
MSDGSNDTWRIWNELKRKEDELGSAAGTFASWGLEQLGRVDRVRKALDDSGPIARRLIADRLAGIDLSAIWAILIAACQDIALYYGGSVIAGGVVGGIGGALLGGAGCGGWRRGGQLRRRRGAGAAGFEIAGRRPGRCHSRRAALLPGRFHQGMGAGAA